MSNLIIDKTDERGYGQPVNPYDLNNPPICFDAGYEQKMMYGQQLKHDDFNEANPSLLVIDQQGAPVINCSDLSVTGPHWQRSEFGKWITADAAIHKRYNNQFVAFLNNWAMYECREVYLLTDPENTEKGKEELSDIENAKIDGYQQGYRDGLEDGKIIADNTPAPLSDKSEVEENLPVSKDLLQKAEDYYKYYWSTLEPPFVPSEPVIEGFCEGYQQGATDQEKLMQGEWVSSDVIRNFIRQEHLTTKWDAYFETLLRNKQ